ncbi:unnamed protein product [Alopecurus aequalis]
MAALLRQGAKRIGGSVLQRSQAAVQSPAVAEEGRRIVPRRMTTTAPFQQLPTAPSFSLRPSELEVQQKKDELYEALSQVENWRNQRLLQDLAVHVYPRQPTMQWRRLRASKWATNVVRAVGNVTFAYTAVIAFDELRVKVNSFFPDEEEIAKAVKTLRDG